MIRIPPVLTEPHLTLASGVLHAVAEPAQLAQPIPR